MSPTGGPEGTLASVARWVGRNHDLVPGERFLARVRPVAHHPAASPCAMKFSRAYLPGRSWAASDTFRRKPRRGRPSVDTGPGGRRLRKWWWACQNLNLGPHPYQGLRSKPSTRHGSGRPGRQRP
jgi:hypothetical protein